MLRNGQRLSEEKENPYQGGQGFSAGPRDPEPEDLLSAHKKELSLFRESARRYECGRSKVDLGQDASVPGIKLNSI